MAYDAGTWYDSYWNVWTELLQAGRGKGVYHVVEEFTGNQFPDV